MFRKKRLLLEGTKLEILSKFKRNKGLVQNGEYKKKGSNKAGGSKKTGYRLSEENVAGETDYLLTTLV